MREIGLVMQEVNRIEKIMFKLGKNKRKYKEKLKTLAFSLKSKEAEIDKLIKRYENLKT